MDVSILMCQPDLQEILKGLRKEDSRAAVIFKTDWSGASHMMVPIFSKIAAKFEGFLNFYEVTCPECDIEEYFGLTCYPTIVFFREGRQIERICGLHSYSEIHQKIKKVYGNG
jgi:thioredoxin-like negative regulator of GroEL